MILTILKVFVSVFSFFYVDAHARRGATLDVAPVANQGDNVGLGVHAVIVRMTLQ